jgi:hypothetical protein
MPSIPFPPDPAAVAARSAPAAEAAPAEALGFSVGRRHAWADALGQRPFGAARGTAGLADIQRRHLAFVRPLLAAFGQAPEGRDAALPIVAGRPIAAGGAARRVQDEPATADAGGATGADGAGPDTNRGTGTGTGSGSGSGPDSGFAVAEATRSIVGGPRVARRSEPRPEAPSPEGPPASDPPAATRFAATSAVPAVPSARHSASASAAGTAPPSAPSAVVARAPASPGVDRAGRIDPTDVFVPPGPSVATGAVRADAGPAGGAGASAPVRATPGSVARAARGGATTPMRSTATEIGTGPGPASEVATVHRAPIASTPEAVPAASVVGNEGPDEGMREDAGVLEPVRSIARKGAAMATASPSATAVTATAVVPAATPMASTGAPPPPHAQRWPRPQPAALAPPLSASLAPSASPSPSSSQSQSQSPSPITARSPGTLSRVVATMPAPQSLGMSARAVSPPVAVRADAWPARTEHRNDRPPAAADRHPDPRVASAAPAGSTAPSIAHGSDGGAGTAADVVVARSGAGTALPGAIATAMSDPATTSARTGAAGRPVVSRSAATAAPRAAPTTRRGAPGLPARLDTAIPVGREPGHDAGVDPGVGTAPVLAHRRAEGSLTRFAPAAASGSSQRAAPAREPAPIVVAPPAPGAGPASMAAGDPGPGATATASVATTVPAPVPMPLPMPMAAAAWRPVLSRARASSPADPADPAVAPRAGAAGPVGTASATAPVVARAARSGSDAPPALLLAAPASASATVASGRHGDAPAPSPSSPADPDTLFRSADEQRFGTTQFADAPPPAPGSPLPSTAAGTATAAGGAGIDLEDLVERAVQALLHRLDIERERRGFAAWP